MLASSLLAPLVYTLLGVDIVRVVQAEQLPFVKLQVIVEDYTKGGGENCRQLFHPKKMAKGRRLCQKRSERRGCEKVMSKLCLCRGHSELPKIPEGE
jgi:hypothetical protein